MIAGAKYVHTNLVARDWRRLADFYIQVFGCVPVPPERRLEDAWVEKATGVPSGAIYGMHLRLPGWDDYGPTLELFQYNRLANGETPVINRPGLAHLAFAVDDVFAALAEIKSHGGSAYGEAVEVEVAGAGRICFVYAADPEGNLIELQKWLR